MTSSAAVDLDAILKDGVRARPDVSALASLDGKKLCVLAWHYHDDDVAGPDAIIELNLRGLPSPNGPARLQQFSIDASHSNAFTAWQRMGSPQPPSAAQIAELESAGQLAEVPAAEPLQIQGGSATLRCSLPRQAVVLMVMELGREEG